MKFVIALQLTDALEKLTIVPPCRGYYTNISIQNSSGIVDPSTASETEKMDHLFLGVNVSELLVQDIADATGEGISVADPPNPYAPRVRGDIMHDHDHLYQKYVYPGVQTDSNGFMMQTKHFGKKRLRIRNDTDLLTLLYKSDLATPNGYLLIQGNFIPYRGALFKQLINVTSLSEDDNWLTAKRVLFTTRLSQAQMKVSLFVDWDTGAYQAIAYFRLRRRGDVEFTDTVASPAGDILDGAFITQDNMSAHGIIGSLNFQTQADAVTKKYETVLNLGDINDGDYLSWDVKVISGTEQGTVNAQFELAGIVPRQEWCEEADFVSSHHFYDINQDINGVYVAL